jgi:predicted  nucleic acid-binding Zn-ribbon protein
VKISIPALSKQEIFKVQSELEKLVELQKTDTNIRRLKSSIESAEQRRASIEQEFEQHASSIREIQMKRDTAQAGRSDLEKQIAENKTYIDRADRNLKNAQNQKEYETAMRELDALQKQVSALETQVLERMTEVEEVEKTLAEREEEINNLESNRAEAMAVFDKELGKNKKQFGVETAKRHEVFITLPPKLASVYNRMAQRSRDGIAVAEVINGSCSACFMKLRPQMQVELKTKDEIMTCESCTRILYIAPTSAPEAIAASQES